MQTVVECIKEIEVVATNYGKTNTVKKAYKQIYRHAERQTDNQPVTERNRDRDALAVRQTGGGQDGRTGKRTKARVADRIDEDDHVLGVTC